MVQVGLVPMAALVAPWLVAPWERRLEPPLVVLVGPVDAWASVDRPQEALVVERNVVLVSFF